MQGLSSYNLFVKKGKQAKDKRHFDSDDIPQFKQTHLALKARLTHLRINDTDSLLVELVSSESRAK